MWTRGLARWYAESGRHDLPWRSTDDPWAILVSEVMLQQTQVSRVAGRWESFVARWPTPESCAAARLDDVLREWQGLGYPRRARALHDSAIAVTARGWPATETGLRELPGVGAYTARALRVLAFGDTGVPPQDVNIARVTARAALGHEPRDVHMAAIEAQLATARPQALSSREFTFALFDAGALHCRARPLCDGCPLASTCASRPRLAIGPSQSARPSARYKGSTRELRGAVLRHMLANPAPRTLAELHERVARSVAGRDRSDVAAVLEALIRERLVSPMRSTGSIT